MRHFQILLKVLKSVIKVILTFIVIWVVFHYSILRVTIVTKPDSTPTNESIPTVSLVTNIDVINILIWSKYDQDFESLQTGQEVFIKRKCNYINCYVTSNRSMLGDNYTLFDAVLISARDSNELPTQRLPNQKYVFATRDLDIQRPMCDKVFSNYFNLTFTTKLDSDAVWSYFPIIVEYKDANLENEETIHDTQMTKSHNLHLKQNGSKEYTTIYIQDCRKNRLQYIIVNVVREMKKFFLDTKVVCADECSKSNECTEDIPKYYFYLILEDQMHPRSVVSDTLKAFHYNTVPVILGSTDYSRYLPRHSFINGWKLGSRKTAITIAKLISNEAAYMAYFKWKLNPFYQANMSSECKLCELLNSKEKKSYQWLSDWWNPTISRCPDDLIAE